MLIASRIFNLRSMPEGTLFIAWHTEIVIYQYNEHDLKGVTG